MTRLHSNNQYGSLTIEATLVVSALVMSLAALIFAFSVMNQRILLTRTAFKAAEEAAAHWVKGNGLYYRLTEDSFLYGDQEITLVNSIAEGVISEQGLSSKGFYEKKLLMAYDKAAQNLSRSLLRPEVTSVRVYYQNGLLARSIHIKINQDLKLPFLNLSAFFSDSDKLKLNGAGSAVITDPVEYMRNIDLMVEYCSKAEKALDLKELRSRLCRW